MTFTSNQSYSGQNPGQGWAPFGNSSSAQPASSQLGPEGLNIGDIVGKALQVAIPVVIGLLQNQPQPQAGAQGQPAGASPQINPQSFNLGLQTPFGGGGMAIASNQPQIGPQGFDLSAFLQQAVGQVSSTVIAQLPNLINGALGALAAQPQLQQMSAGPGGQLSPQSFFGSIGHFLGNAAQTVGHAVVGQVAQQLPHIVQGAVLSFLSANPQLGQPGQGAAQPGFSPQGSGLAGAASYH